MTEFPPFKLDPVNQCLWRSTGTGSDQRVELRPKTFDVLRYLVENPGRLITHDELLDELWHAADVQQDILKAHILIIRKALDDVAREPRYILTLRKRGYEFIAPVSSDGVSQKQSRATFGKFVGRIQPLSDLQRALRMARENVPQLVFVTGDAGIGKTELVERFLDDVGDDQDTSVAVGRCFEGYGGIEPYYPVLEALHRLSRHRNAEGVMEALTTVAPTWAAQLPGLLSKHVRATLHQQIAASSRDRMVREFCELMDKLGERRTLVLALEDVHWSDYSTVDLLSAFVRRRCHARALVIATYRSGDAAASKHPIHRLSHEMLAHKFATALTLPPLGSEAVTEFVASAFAGAEAEKLAHWVAEQSSGNPLLMIATLENLIERGLIAPDTDGFRLCVPVTELRVEISSDLSQVLESHISQLNEREQTVLAVGSVAGMTFDPATSALASGMTSIDFEEVCETLVRNDKCISKAGLKKYPDGTVVQEYSFKHLLYRRALYERQGPIRLAHSQRGICEALERLASPALSQPPKC
jgi:predicted ATPase